MAIFNSYVKLPEGTIAAKKSTSWKPGIDDIYHIFTNKKTISLLDTQKPYGSKRYE